MDEKVTLIYYHLVNNCKLFPHTTLEGQVIHLWIYLYFPIFSLRTMFVMKCTGRIKDLCLIIHDFVSYLKNNCKWKDRTINLPYSPSFTLQLLVLWKQMSKYQKLISISVFDIFSWWQILYFDRALIMRTWACTQ